MKSSEATGLQIAFLTFAIALLSAPSSKWLLSLVHTQFTSETVGRLFTLLVGAVCIVAFPAVRSRAREYLRRPIAKGDRAEVALASLLVVISGFAMVGGMVIWQLLFNPSGPRITGLPAERALALAVSQDGLLFLIAAVVAAPLVEELVFRGFLFDAWERRWGWKVSALLTSTVFALYHKHFFAAFFASIIFVCVLRRTGSLRASIAVHAVSNFALWYPLLGQFVFPHVGSNPALRAWTPHFAAMGILVISIPLYVWLADSRSRSQDSAVI